MLVAGNVGVSQSRDSKLAETLKAAEEAKLKKDFPRAAEEYRKAVELQPSSEVYEKLGLVYFLQDSHARAIEAFSQAVHVDPGRWSSQLFLGISLYKMNRFREAVVHIEKAVRLNPRQYDARYWLGLTYDALGNYQKGIAQLRTVLENDPKNVDVLYALAEAYLDFSTTLSRGSGNQPEDGKDREVLEERAGIKRLIVSSSSQSWDESVRSWRGLEARYSQISDAPHQDSESLYILSRVYAELAQLMANRVCELGPDSPRAHQLLGEAFEGKEDYERALEEYAKAIQLSPRAPGLHYSLGHAYWQMKRFDDAIPEMEKELALNPHHASANYVLGHIYLYKRQVSRAARYLQSAVEANPDFAEARKQWGKALSLLDDDQRALNQLELAASADPEDDSVHYLLAGVYRKMGLQAKAQKELEVFNQLRRQRHRHDEPPE